MISASLMCKPGARKSSDDDDDDPPHHSSAIGDSGLLKMLSVLSYLIARAMSEMSRLVIVLTFTIHGDKAVNARTLGKKEEKKSI